MDRNGSEGIGRDGRGKERMGMVSEDRSGEDRRGTDWIGTVWNGMVSWNGMERKGEEWSGKDRFSWFPTHNITPSTKPINLYNLYINVHPVQHSGYVRVGPA
jgi:hypothetical protein